MTRGMVRKTSRRLKKVMILGMATLCLALVAVFVGYRYLDIEPSDALLPLPGAASLVLNRIHQTATRNGIVEWQLNADSARYIDSRQQAILEDPSVTFYLDDDRTVTLTAGRGTLHTASKNLTVTGNVVMGYAGFTFETGVLYYDHDRREIFSKTPVNLSGDAFRLRADAMVFDLKSAQTVFRGHIEGSINETI